MYKVTRLISYIVKQTAEYEEHIIKKSYATFLLTDKHFHQLYNLKREYDYKTFDNILCIDRHPATLEDFLPSEMVKDYAENVNDKFFVLYEYIRVENV